VKRAPTVYVLILNWNQKQITIDCVESVLESHYTDFEVVVLDNGSTDGSASALRTRFGKGIEVIENGTNLGYARGFNVGLKYAFESSNADYALVMNNDTIIDPYAITELVRVADADAKIGFVTGKVYYYNMTNILQTVGKENDPIRWNGDHIGCGEQDLGQYDEVRELHFADDIFTLASKHLYDEIRGYDPMFFLQGEEYDWQARAKNAGYKIMYTPRAKLWHKVSMTLGKDSALKAYYDARNPMLVVMLHKPQCFFRRYFWNHLRKDIMYSSLIYVKQGRITPAMAKWQGLMSGLKWGIRKKKLTIKHVVGNPFG
jgi:GT2 family glycosyltransferase